jgi:CheY-like chemotaxis protein
MVSISDSGKGIPESDREKLFQPFFTTKPDGAGTGLGLAIVYAAIKDFGGVIDVESAEGHGTTISFWLPLAKRSGKKPSKKIVSSRARPSAGRATLLYVEDDAHTRRVTSESLAARGCNVLAAANGLEAIDLFERHRDKIDLAILDIVLPKLGGDEVIKQIRNRHVELPVVICSGYIGQLVDPDLLKSPNTWLINKPYKMDELVETLENALGWCEISTAAGV